MAGRTTARAIARGMGAAAAALAITSRFAVYTGPEDPAIGASTWSGLPAPSFHQSAPGLNLYGAWYHTLWLNLAIWTGLIYWLLARRRKS